MLVHVHATLPNFFLSYEVTRYTIKAYMYAMYNICVARVHVTFAMSYVYMYLPACTWNYMI